MTLLNIAGLSTAMLLLAITPGPGVLATVSKALSAGFVRTIPLILGIVLGDLLFLLFAVYGLSFVAESFHGLFVWIRIAGALYLIGLGVALWRSKTQTHASPLPHANRQSFLSGLSITLGNPKVILFYLGFLPAFIDLETLSSYDVLTVAIIVSLVLGSVMLLYALATSRAKALFQNDKRQTLIQRVAGTVMISAGVLLLTKS